MDDKSQEKLTVYMLESTITGRLYLDNENVCDVSLSEEDKTLMPKGKTEVRVSSAKRYTMDEIASLCYAAGADAIRFYKSKSSKKATLHPERLISAPYNHLLNQLLCRAKQASDYSKLLRLSECSFFVPVRIEQEGEVDIFYATAKHARIEGLSYFITFSTIEEYQIWASAQHGYKPVKIGYEALRRVSGSHGWIINPQGNQLVLSNEILKRLEGGGK